MSNSEIDITIIVPDAKDNSRAARLCLHRGVWQASPMWSAASQMAQAIDDPYKLVRRSKAVVRRYGGHHVVSPFVARLKELGFTVAQIKQICAPS